jgi:Fe-S cluster assembly iron-binding protein IscA
MTQPTPSIEVTDKAKERLRAILASEGKPRLVRIEVGRG